MMSVSSTVSPPGAVCKKEDSNLDLARLDDVPSPQGCSTAYAQLVHDQLDAVIKSHRSTAFTDMLTKIIKSLDSPAEDTPADSTRANEQKLLATVRTLSSCLDKLDQNLLMPIVSVLLQFDRWRATSPQITESYVQFFSVLVSGSPKWWTEIAQKVVAQFVQPVYDMAAQHAVVQRIIAIVPTSSAGLPEVFTNNFPHQSSPARELVNYTENLLKVLEYAPEQLASIWQLIIQKFITLDVECERIDEAIQRRLQADSDSDMDSDSDLDSDSELDSDSDLDSDSGSDLDSDMESDSDDKKSLTNKRPREEDSDDEDDEESLSVKRQKVRDVAIGEEVTNVELEMAASMSEPIAAKVDAVLSMLLQYLTGKFTPQAVKSGEATPLFKVLLRVFREIVLPTADVQAVQFIWFHITHAHPDLLASFISVLLETALSSDTSFEQRVRAMQYVASFVARAKGLTRPQIVFVVGFLANWVQRYIKEREHEVDGSLSMARFRMFYAAVQALFYIFVFRHAMLRDEHGSGGWVAKLDKLFPQVINSKFNPLQYCQPQVVAMFARVAQHEEVASCYSIIERNRWGSFRSKADDAHKTHTGAQNGLFDNNRDSKLYDSFFPFQPLRLKNSKNFFQDSFEKWSEVDLSDSDTDLEMYSSESDY